MERKEQGEVKTDREGWRGERRRRIGGERKLVRKWKENGKNASND